MKHHKNVHMVDMSMPNQFEIFLPEIKASCNFYANIAVTLRGVIMYVKF